MGGWRMGLAAGRLWVAASLVLGCFTGCSDEKGGTDAERNRLQACIPGETRLCSGPGACAGAQACLETGAGFGACDCGETTAPASADAASANAPPDAGPSLCAAGETRACAGPEGCSGTQRCDPQTGFGDCTCSGAANLVGAPCARNEDCGRDLECWADSTLNYLGISGGAAHGYCTTVCATSNDCVNLDTASLCWSQPGAQGMCARGCLSKDPLVLAESKCLNRPDLTCWSTAAIGQEALRPERQFGVCLPRCGSDADCPGRFCNLSSGLCESAPLPGAAIGAPCTLDADCAGQLCLEFTNGARTCSAPCTFGSLSGCGYAADATAREAACLIPFLDDGFSREGSGDLGLCLELCDTDADCESPSSICIIEDLGTGRAGACDPSGPALPDAGAP